MLGIHSIDTDKIRLEGAREIIIRCEFDPEAVLQKMQGKQKIYVANMILKIAEVYLDSAQIAATNGEADLWMLEDSHDLLTEYLDREDSIVCWQHAALWTHLWIIGILLELGNAQPPLEMERQLNEMKTGRRKALRYLLRMGQVLNFYVLNAIFAIETSEREALYLMLQRHLDQSNQGCEAVRHDFAFCKRIFDIQALYFKLTAAKEQGQNMEEQFLQWIETEEMAIALLARYYLFALYVDQEKWGHCHVLLEGKIDELQETWGDYCYGVGCLWIGKECGQNQGQERDALQWLLRAKEALQRPCLALLNTLYFLIQLYETGPCIDLIEHKLLVGEFLDLFVFVCGDGNSELIKHCFLFAAHFLDLGNDYDARNIIELAKESILEIYGENSCWMDSIALFDAKLFKKEGDFQKARACLELAMEFYLHMDESVEQDEFIRYLVASKASFLQTTQNEYFNLGGKLETEETMSTREFMENFYKIYLPMLQEGKADEVIALLAKGFGGSETFIRMLLSDIGSWKNYNAEILPQFMTLVPRMLGMQAMIERTQFDQVPDAARLAAADELIVILTEGIELFPKGSSSYEMAETHLMTYLLDVCRGYLKFGQPEKAHALLEKYEQFAKSAGGELSWLMTRCLVFDALHDEPKVKKHLQALLALQNQLVSQMLTMDKEERQLSLLKQFEDALPVCIYMLLRYVGVWEAYEFLLKNKVLTLDYVHLTKQYKAAASVMLDEKDLYRQIFDEKVQNVFAGLPTDTALVEFTKVWAGVEKADYYAFILQGEQRLQAVSLGDVNEVDACVQRLREGIEAESNCGEASALSSLPGFLELKDRLIAPIGQQMGKTINAWMIAPEGELFRVPFHIFFESSPMPIVYTFTGKDLLQHSENQRTQDDTRLKNALIIGASKEMDGGDLPAVECEVRIVAKCIDGTATRKSKIDLQDWQNEYDLIHIASHADYAGEQELIMATSRFNLEDGQIWTAAQIAEEDFSTSKLITLSACGTGSGTSTNYEGLLGLSRAFMHSGAPRLLVTLWPVEDISTCIFMKKFYEELRSDLKGVHTALLKAQRFLRTLTVAQLQEILQELTELYPALDCEMLQLNLRCRPKERRYYDSPYYWAPFVLFGSYGERGGEKENAERF